MSEHFTGTILEIREKLRANPGANVTIHAPALLHCLDWIDAMLETLDDLVAWVGKQDDRLLDETGFTPIWERSAERMVKFRDAALGVPLTDAHFEECSSPQVKRLTAERDTAREDRNSWARDFDLVESALWKLVEIEDAHPDTISREDRKEALFLAWDKARRALETKRKAREDGI